MYSLPLKIGLFELTDASLSGDEYVAQCGLSKDCEGKRKPTLYVNRVSGAYICHRCGARGFLNGNSSTNAENSNRNAEIVDGLQSTINYKLSLDYVQTLSMALWLPVGKPGLDYLLSRGLSEATIRSHYLGYDPNRQAVSIPNLDYNQHVLSLKYRSIGDGDRYTQESLGGMKQYPYRIARISPDSDKPLIITEGEFDALSISEIDPLLQVIGLPGKESFPKAKDESGLLDLIKSFKRVILCPDNELTSQLSFRRFKAILGRNVNCQIMRVPTGFKDVNEWLVQAKPDSNTLAQLIAQSESYYDVAYTGLQKLEAQSQDDFKKDIDRGAATDWPALNKAIAGIRPGELTLLAGSGGSGKSTIATQILHRLVKDGNHGLMGSFEMSITKAVIPRLEGLSVGKNLFNAEDKTYPNTDYLKRVVFVLPNTVEPTVAAFSQALGEIYKKGKLATKPLVFCLVDNLTRFKFGRGLTSQDKQALVEEGVMALKNLTRLFPNLHLMILCHTTKTPTGGSLTKDSVRGSGVVVAEADNVMLVEPTEDGVNIRIEKVRCLAGVRSEVVSLIYDKSTAILTDGGEF